MVAAANLVEVAALVGDTARAKILAALMSGQALTGTELAYVARITRPTASEHLTKLSQARLVETIKQGRFRYYRIASPLVAAMLESIIAVAAIEVPSRHQPRSPQEQALRFARTCYDHLAGRLGVAIADAIVTAGYVVLGEDGGEMTDSGRAFLTDLGADLSSASKTKRIFCKPCLDWSERRYHLAGWVGAEICRSCADRGWIVRGRDTRAVKLSSAGRDGLRELFGQSFLGEPSANSTSRVVSAIGAD